MSSLTIKVRMDQLVISNARGRFLQLLAFNFLLLLLTLFVLFMLYLQGTAVPLIGWLATFLLILGIPVLLWQALEKRPHLVVDRHGVWYRPFGIEVIPWQVIRDIRLIQVIGAKIIVLDLVDAQHYIDQAAPFYRLVANLNRAMGYPPFSLNLTRIGANAEEVFQRMQMIRTHQ